jgi:hypothetical protein
MIMSCREQFFAARVFLLGVLKRGFVFCSKCGAPLNGAAFCSACGTSVVVAPSAPVNPNYSGVPQAPSTNGLAIAGFVISIVGFFFLNWLGLIFGIVALNQINKSEGRQGGRGLAIAAIVIGSLFLIPVLSLFSYFSSVSMY